LLIRTRYSRGSVGREKGGPGNSRPTGFRECDQSTPANYQNTATTTRQTALRDCKIAVAGPIPATDSSGATKPQVSSCQIQAYSSSICDGVSMPDRSAGCQFQSDLSALFQQGGYNFWNLSIPVVLP
jgi:hypothetical protein